MEQNTEQLKKEFYLLYGRFDSSTGHLIGMMPPESIEGIWDFFLPHLISSDEIKREAVEGFASRIIEIYDSLISKSENSNTIGVFLLTQKVVNDLKVEYLTQSKEGGENGN